MCFDWIIYKISFLCFLLLEQCYTKIVHIARVEYKQDSPFFFVTVSLRITHAQIYFYNTSLYQILYV